LKTLIIMSHPNIENSVINKRWVEELKKYPEKYTVHELYNIYPDGNIDVEKEQQLIESHHNLVLQFPFYWFNCPPLLKKWLDDVFTYGWAYGSNGGDKLKNRKVGLAVSAEHLLSPFETTLLYCNADYRSFFAFYGTESEPGENEPGKENEPVTRHLEKSTKDYLNFIDTM
jgi:putative NADPH-quinone reductase